MNFKSRSICLVGGGCAGVVFGVKEAGNGGAGRAWYPKVARTTRDVRKAAKVSWRNDGPSIEHDFKLGERGGVTRQRLRAKLDKAGAYGLWGRANRDLGKVLSIHEICDNIQRHRKTIGQSY